MRTARPAGILATGGFAPARLLTNADLERIVDTSDEWIRSRSGITTRHIVEPGQGASDIALPAARQALERAGIAPGDVELIIVATLTADYPLPTTSCLLQRELGAKDAAVFDLQAACTGFIYGLTVAEALVSTGKYGHALVIGVDVLSSVTDYTDRGTCVLFGDAAGAAVIGPVEEGRGILSTYLRADGNGAEMLTIPAGGSRRPPSAETVAAREHFIRMNGSEVFKFAVRALADALATPFSRADLQPTDVDIVIPHQANVRIIDLAAERTGVPRERWFVNLQEYGNTSAASVPLALNEAFEAGRIKAGDTVALAGFGGGLTWGGAVVRW